MGEGARFSQVQAKILGKRQQAPQRRQGLPLPERGHEEVHGHDQQIGRQDAKGPFDEKIPQQNPLPTRGFHEQFRGNEVAAQHKKQVHPRPAKGAHGRYPFRMGKNAVVKTQYQDNSQCPQVVEAVKFLERGNRAHVA